MKKTLLSLVVLTALVAFGAAQAEAATPSADISVTVTLTQAELSVTVDPTSWTPTLALGETTETSPPITATNDTANRTETLSIVCTDPNAVGWSIGSAVGPETYVMEATGGDLVSPTSIDTLKTLETGVVAGGDVTFTLTFTAPTLTETLSDSMTVTVSAS